MFVVFGVALEVLLAPHKLCNLPLNDTGWVKVLEFVEPLMNGNSGIDSNLQTV